MLSAFERARLFHAAGGRCAQCTRPIRAANFISERVREAAAA